MNFTDASQSSPLFPPLGELGLARVDWSWVFSSPHPNQDKHCKKLNAPVYLKVFAFLLLLLEAEGYFSQIFTVRT